MKKVKHFLAIVLLVNTGFAWAEVDCLTRLAKIRVGCYKSRKFFALGFSLSLVLQNNLILGLSASSYLF